MNLKKIQLTVLIDSMTVKENLAKQCNKKLVQYVTDARYSHARAKDIVRTSQRDLSGIHKLLHTKIPEEEVQRIVSSIQKHRRNCLVHRMQQTRQRNNFSCPMLQPLEVLGCQGDVSTSQQCFHISGE